MHRRTRQELLGPSQSESTGLTSRLAVVELIANTTTKTGLTIRCELDTNTYPKGIKVLALRVF
jgi:hypothetical protein